MKPGLQIICLDQTSFLLLAWYKFTKLLRWTAEQTKWTSKSVFSVFRKHDSVFEISQQTTTLINQNYQTSIINSKHYKTKRSQPTNIDIPKRQKLCFCLFLQKKISIFLQRGRKLKNPPFFTLKHPYRQTYGVLQGKNKSQKKKISGIIFRQNKQNPKKISIFYWKIFGYQIHK